MLYFDAGRNLLTDNFLYFKALSDHAALDAVYICNILNYPFKNKRVLYDKQGCCSQYIMDKIISDNLLQGDVYVFSDDEFLCNKMQGIYIKNFSFFVFDSRFNDNSLFLYNLNHCYYNENNQRRTYSNDDYISLAEYFFSYPL